MYYAKFKMIENQLFFNIGAVPLKKERFLRAYVSTKFFESKIVV